MKSEHRARPELLLERVAAVVELQKPQVMPMIGLEWIMERPPRGRARPAGIGSMCCADQLSENVILDGCDSSHSSHETDMFKIILLKMTVSVWFSGFGSECKLKKFSTNSGRLGPTRFHRP
ncbi:hypothetical protein F2P81_023182 [Scophthalmus maximus]|uniref:Uncharacterized protein n=1 Tax=Scophthalmus maximus TaxID=52904 RepID=A0A6A4RYH4_SCOMX|nr:hypothetical protein F2P81_023182 [Scophthalmus maximus]